MQQGYERCMVEVRTDSMTSDDNVSGLVFNAHSKLSNKNDVNVDVYQ